MQSLKIMVTAFPNIHREVLDTIAMYTAQKQLVVGWLASQTDMLADDWEIV